MTKTGYVFANLFRKKTRFVLTLLSIILAFMLFGLLQAINVMFNAGADFVGATRLITQARVSFTQTLPIRQLAQLKTLPGVKEITYQQWFGVVTPDDVPGVGFAVDPVTLHTVYPEWVMPEEHWQAFANTRSSLIVGKMLADKYGWKIGDKVPIRSNIFPKRDGSKNWAFDLVGIFDGKDDTWKTQTQILYINFEYFNEENQFMRDRVGNFILQLEDGTDPAAIAVQADKLFENSPDETKTQTEKDFNVNFIKQLGDIGLMVRWILFAVFFTLLMVVGNTMAQSVRERIPELATLKTLGFSDSQVLWFVISEALILCGLGGLIGIGLATLIGKGIAQNAMMLPIEVNYAVWSVGLIAIVVMALAVSLLPALRAKRLNIVDALAGR